jgi:hypothetical protein
MHTRPACGFVTDLSPLFPIILTSLQVLIEIGVKIMSLYVTSTFLQYTKLKSNAEALMLVCRIHLQNLSADLDDTWYNGVYIKDFWRKFHLVRRISI